HTRDRRPERRRAPPPSVAPAPGLAPKTMTMIATPAPAPGDASHSAAPVWLEFSGLPQALHEVRKNAWIVFKKLVELDCERHPAAPGVVVASPAEIALRTGFDAAAVAQACDGLRRKRLIRVFRPRDPGDDM